MSGFPKGWAWDGRACERQTDRGYVMRVQAVATDHREWSVEAEIKCNGLTDSRLWIGDTGPEAYLAATWWCEGVAHAADWHEAGAQETKTGGPRG